MLPVTGNSSEATAYRLLMESGVSELRFATAAYALADRRPRRRAEVLFPRQVSRKQMIDSRLWVGLLTDRKVPCRVLFKHELHRDFKAKRKVPDNAPTTVCVVRSDSSTIRLDDAMLWISENCVGQWCYTGQSLYFELEEDAVAAKVFLE